MLLVKALIDMQYMAHFIPPKPGERENLCLLQWMNI